MNWLQLFELLDRECKLWRKDILEKTRAKKIPLTDDPAEVQRQRKITKGVDLACEYYSKNFSEKRRWPIIEPVMVMEIYHRLQEAKAFAKFVSCPEIPREHPAQTAPMRLSDSEILRWILIDYWPIAGQWRQIYTIAIPYEE